MSSKDVRVPQRNLPELEECLQQILEQVKGQKREILRVPLNQSCGKVLAENVYSPISVPPYSKSAMDGYAVVASELEGASGEHPVTLQVVGELFAGDFEEVAHIPLSAVRVMTGAYVPSAFDAVIRQEDTDYGEEQVEVYTSVAKYRNYCPEGEDIQKGALVLAENTKLTPVHIGLLASVGLGEVSVRKPVSAAIISTGSELCPAGNPLPEGKIYNNIGPMLAAAIEREGLNVYSLSICPDEEQALRDTISAALEGADIVITTGGVSVGKKDLVPGVLKALDARILFTGANIQPGTPTTVGVRGGKILLCLSGNPYAAIVNFEYYFWSLAAALMECEDFLAETRTATLQSAYPKVNGLRRMVRARVEGDKVYLPSAVHASSVLHNLTECNCFLDLEAGRSVSVGDEVRIRMIKGK